MAAQCKAETGQQEWVLKGVGGSNQGALGSDSNYLISRWKLSKDFIIFSWDFVLNSILSWKESEISLKIIW